MSEFRETLVKIIKCEKDILDIKRNKREQQYFVNLLKSILIDYDESLEWTPFDKLPDDEKDKEVSFVFLKNCKGYKKGHEFITIAYYNMAVREWIYHNEWIDGALVEKIVKIKHGWRELRLIGGEK
jgi:hypothetical protein